MSTLNSDQTKKNSVYEEIQKIFVVWNPWYKILNNFNLKNNLIKPHETISVDNDTIEQSENVVYLFTIHFLSSIIFIYLLNKSKRSSISYLLPIIVLIYRWNLFSSLTSVIPLLYYGLLGYLIVRKEISIENLLFSLLYILCRPHNCLIIIIHMIFYQFLNINDSRLAFILSQSAFFHLGNSNSFVTIDISTGFVGIPIYLPIIHGILIYLSTYGLSIVWLLKLSKEERIHSLLQLTLINSSFVLCIFLQRYHLFVWTVFAPKVFYLCTQTAFNLIYTYIMSISK
ncbi:unnamed protein product [Adineta steineri]|uniref:GPI ethanolamine phosphate transferase 2 C-terminal domain-containing protein n=1 Tax=Adineta steineri TaxID=433720 RepID=A0A815RHR4_9BILA|nr:unnamed protein product [Adineta steineri]